MILFTRFPQPGATKTRLIPLLGTQGAADLQREMTEHVTGQICKFLATHPVRVDIRFDGGDAAQMGKWLGRGFNYHPQGPGDIGCRMRTAFKDAFAAGAKTAVLIGGDVPGISALILHKAFTALTHENMVIGPARDGGYYLLGLRDRAFSRIGHFLFDGCNWGGDRVFAKTVANAGKDGISCIILEELTDIDRPEDLPVWHRVLQKKIGRYEKKRFSDHFGAQ